MTAIVLFVGLHLAPAIGVPVAFALGLATLAAILAGQYP